MDLYCQKSNIVEAKQLTLFNSDDIKEWCNGQTWSRPPMRAVSGLSFKTLGITMYAKYGDFIIKTIEGDFYPASEEHFHKKYQSIRTTNGY